MIETTNKHKRGNGSVNPCKRDGEKTERQPFWHCPTMTREQKVRDKASSQDIPAVYMWDNGGLNVLIPKRKGSGYLACPLGHHVVKELSAIETDEKVVVCGLDGYLAFEYGYKDKSEKLEIVNRVLPRLAKHYGFKTWHEDYKFWNILLYYQKYHTSTDTEQSQCL